MIACHYVGFDQGRSGVDLFFVLSGYLIGGILVDSRDQPGYFSSFYGRRAFRILPLYWILLAVAPPVHWGYYLVFAQQIPWVQFGYPLEEPTFVTWSLAIEEQFYLVLPALIFWLPRRWLIRVLWSGVLLAPVWRCVFHNYLPGNSWQFLLPGRLDELFGGVLIACLCVAIAAPLLHGERWPACRRFSMLCTPEWLARLPISPWQRLHAVSWYGPPPTWNGP